MEYLKKEEIGLLLDFYKKSNLSNWGANIKETLEVIYEQKGGYVLVEKENGQIKHFMIALDIFALKKTDRTKAFYSMLPSSFKKPMCDKERKYLQKEIIWNCLTTFMILTDYLEHKKRLLGSQSCPRRGKWWLRGGMKERWCFLCRLFCPF